MSDAIQPLPIQRTKRGLEFERFYDNVRNMLDGKSKEDQDKAAAANAQFIRGLRERPEFVHTKGGNAPGAVHTNALLTTFSLMYTNDEFIGERLMPFVGVDKRSNTYVIHNKRDSFKQPDDEIGHRARPNEVDHGHSTDNYSVVDRSLMDFVDDATVQNQDAPLNEMLDSLAVVNNSLGLNREVRQAALLCASGSYAGNTAAAATAWNDPSGGSVETDIPAGDAEIWSSNTPTRKLGFCDITTWNACFRTNPVIFDKYKYTQAGGLITQQVAQFFGLDDILVGRARKDSANEGQSSATYGRVWTTGVFGVVRVAARPTTRTLTWGVTFRLNGDPQSTSWRDEAPGRGGVYNKVAFAEVEKVVAGDAGYLWTGVSS